MGFAEAVSGSPVPLESVICTPELDRRQARQPDHEALVAALVTLAQTMANAPERILQQLAETALSLCFAHSAGISLLEEENGRKIFRWHGVAGQYSPHLWGTTPRDFSPCGTVLDTDKVQLMSHPDLHFRYFAGFEPRIEEALLIPFHVDGEAVGTIWGFSHNPARQFDAEDARVMSVLAEFAAAAYQAVSRSVALKNLVATSREPLLVMDRELRVKVASRSFYQTFHASPGVTEGRFLYQLGNGEWNIPSLRSLLKDILTKEEVEKFEVTQNFPSLGRRVMLLNARKLWSEGVTPNLILLEIEDVTERKSAEKELVRSHEDSQRFAHVAAHDLRAPLSSALVLLQLLSQRSGGKMEDDDRHVLSMARANLQRLQVLMDDILAYTRVGGAQNKEILQLQEPLQMALSNLQKDIDEAGAQVTFGILPTVKADRSQLTLVFQNLISNALKFRTDQPPLLHIAALMKNREWVVSVADNGQGFDPRYASEIFLPFRRLHGPETPGSGIGLATCQRVIERMGGRIWANSTTGNGATFYFTLSGY